MAMVVRQPQGQPLGRINSAASLPDLRSCALEVWATGDQQAAEASADSNSELLEACKSILLENDNGGYTIPAKGLYPYQWNWDSALVALGWASINEIRAWEEMEKLLSAQWEDGMVPHIVFHRPSPTYFPGPDIWGTAEHPRSSTGITQPPVAAITVRKLAEDAMDTDQALRRLGAIFPKLLAWHRWFYRARDPEGTGLVATLHPWESGMDNSPAWDQALARVPVDSIPPYVRQDLGHVDSAMRPSKEDYDRYLTLLYRFREADYDLTRLYSISPFRVSDLCTNCILHRANADLLWMAQQLGEQEAVREIEGWRERTARAFDSLYDARAGFYFCRDQLTGTLVPSKTSASFLPLFAGIASPEQAAALAQTLRQWLEAVQYGVPSLDPFDPGFEPLRYWRGPVWAIVNWMVADGLLQYGYHQLAQRIKDDTHRLLSQHGLYEYYNPITGAGAGGNYFSWTAAMCLAWLAKP